MLIVSSLMLSCVFVVPSYRVGLDVSISFEFRTSRTNGVVLAISNKDSDGLGIEIVDGKVNSFNPGQIEHHTFRENIPLISFKADRCN